MLYYLMVAAVFFIGGSFTNVGNTARTYLAHILSNGSIDPAFNVNLNGSVQCLATDGTNLYIGGDFTTVNSTTRNYAASVAISTGALTTFNPNANSSVLTIAYSGGTVYMGGYFTTMKGSSRNYAAAVTTSNSLTNWAPNPNNYVYKIIPNNNGTSVFISGAFTTVKGASFNYIAKTNNTNGTASASWKPNPNGDVYTMLLNGSTMYMSGYFSTINGVSRQYFAAVDTSSNNPTSLSADLNSIANSMVISAGKLYLGGYFTAIGDSSRNYVARIDIASGLVDSWSGTNSIVNPDSYVNAIAVYNTNVVIGGGFYILSLRSRNYLAAIDLSTSNYAVKSWQPDIINFHPSSIENILHYGHDVFVCGSLYCDTSTNGMVSGVYMYNLISLNDSTGKISHQFTQYPNSTVSSMCIYDNKLMVRGYF